jgi:DNA-binding response OmpR family regulator
MAAEGKHILLIEDDPNMHDAVKMILEPEGYRVTCCSTGPEGLETLRRERPDLLLLDIMLATPSEGFHVAYEIKRDDLLKDTPIIMISSIGHTMGMDYAKELGSEYMPAEQFLEKPIDAATLRAAVKKVLEDRE